MSYIPHCNELDVFSAVRHGHWAELATNLAANAKKALENHKTGSLGVRSTYRDRERKAEELLLPQYPMLGVFLMQHKEGSDKLLAALKTDPYVKRLDSSQLVMHLVKTNTSDFIWALNEGWAGHLGLLQSRQIKMKWAELRAELKTTHERETVDTWMRKWAKRNPMLLCELQTPTAAECKTLLVEHLYYSHKELKVLFADETFQGFYHALESLGQLDPKHNRTERAKLLRGYFTQEPVAQLSLPDNFFIEP